MIKIPERVKKLESLHDFLCYYHYSNRTKQREQEKEKKKVQRESNIDHTKKRIQSKQKLTR